MALFVLLMKLLIHFHDYNKEELLFQFESDYYKAYNEGVSLNPILNAFQQTVKQYNIEDHLVQAF